MSSCEKCWADASRVAYLAMSSTADEYQRLMTKRKDNPCTPEAQAGECAGECPSCGRKTIHQHTKEPMCGCSAAVCNAKEGK